jgi:hypothetical protein
MCVGKLEASCLFFFQMSFCNRAPSEVKCKTFMKAPKHYWHFIV